jgi:hypothetical protein
MKKCSNCGTDVSYWGDGDVICEDCYEKLMNEGKGVINNEDSPKIDITTENIKHEYQNNNKSGCYIATVCYGNENTTQVVILKKYRDEILVKRIWGKTFISLYYKFSPKVSDFLRNKKTLNKIIKTYILDKVVHHVTKKHFDNYFKKY